MNKICVAQDLSASSIDARTIHNLYLIFKEALHNIAKHSNATHVDVQMHKNQTHLHFTIQDNGKEMERKSISGQGLLNMQIRAARLKGKLNTGYTEQGFQVVCVIPI